SGQPRRARSRSAAHLVRCASILRQCLSLRAIRHLSRGEYPSGSTRQLIYGPSLADVTFSTLCLAIHAATSPRSTPPPSAAPDLTDDLAAEPRTLSISRLSSWPSRSRPGASPNRPSSAYRAPSGLLHSFGRAVVAAHSRVAGH